jgi:Mg2+-importing ATPase
MTVKKTKKRKNAFQYDHETAFRVAAQPAKSVFELLETKSGGLSDAEVATRNEQYGDNEIAREQRDSGLVMLIKTFINPFIGILMALAIVSLVIDVLMAEPHDREWITVVIIGTMVVLSAVLRFVQE